jgi:hypothetical protein
MPSTGLRRLALAVVAALPLVGALPSASRAADDVPVRFVARVSWVASDTMVVSTADNPAVSVDLTRVPQDEYQRLVTGAYVIVTGTLGWRRVTATSIETLEP